MKESPVIMPHCDAVTWWHYDVI